MIWFSKTDVQSIKFFEVIQTSSKLNSVNHHRRVQTRERKIGQTLNKKKDFILVFVVSHGVILLGFVPLQQ